jgi:hypothetical protein
VTVGPQSNSAASCFTLSKYLGELSIFLGEATPPLVDTAVIETKTEYQLRGAVIVGGEVPSCPRGSQTSLSLSCISIPYPDPPQRAESAAITSPDGLFLCRGDLAACGLRTHASRRSRRSVSSFPIHVGTAAPVVTTDSVRDNVSRTAGSFGSPSWSAASSAPKDWSIDLASRSTGARSALHT